MPQSFHVLRCYKCEVFQVNIVKKSPKWECKICGVKQSVLKVFGEGTGKECRDQVQRLNDRRRDIHEALETMENASYSHQNVQEPEKEMSCSVRNEKSKWNKFLEVKEQKIESETDDCEDLLEIPQERKRKWGAWGNGKNKVTKKSRNEQYSRNYVGSNVLNEQGNRNYVGSNVRNEQGNKNYIGSYVRNEQGNRKYVGFVQNEQGNGNCVRSKVQNEDMTKNVFKTMSSSNIQRKDDSEFVDRSENSADVILNSREESIYATKNIQNVLSFSATKDKKEILVNNKFSTSSKWSKYLDPVEESKESSDLCTINNEKDLKDFESNLVNTAKDVDRLNVPKSSDNLCTSNSEEDSSCLFSSSLACSSSEKKVQTNAENNLINQQSRLFQSNDEDEEDLSTILFI